MSESTDSQGQPIGELLADRRAKLERLREAAIDPFPHGFDRREEIVQVRSARSDLATGEETSHSHG